MQGIFSDLIALVAEQGDSIQRLSYFASFNAILILILYYRLDANIDNTVIYVDRGHSALLEHIYSIKYTYNGIFFIFYI